MQCLTKFIFSILTCNIGYSCGDTCPYPPTRTAEQFVITHTVSAGYKFDIHYQNNYKISMITSEYYDILNCFCFESATNDDTTTDPVTSGCALGPEEIAQGVTCGSS